MIFVIFMCVLRIGSALFYVISTVLLMVASVFGAAGDSFCFFLPPANTVLLL